MLSGQGGPLLAVSPRCAPRLWGLTLQKWVVLLGPHTVFVPQQQRPGAALPEAPGPGPVSFLLTEGGCEQSQEQGECDGVAASSLCADWDCVAEDTQGLTKPGLRGGELQSGFLPKKYFLNFYSRNDDISAQMQIETGCRHTATHTIQTSPCASEHVTDDPLCDQGPVTQHLGASRL